MLQPMDVSVRAGRPMPTRVLARMATTGIYLVRVLKALNPTPFGIRDPLFDQEVAFYVFRLPLWSSLYGWLRSSPSLVWPRSPCTSAPGAFRSPPGVSRSPDGPGVTSWPWLPCCSS